MNYDYLLNNINKKPKDTRIFHIIKNINDLKKIRINIKFNPILIEILIRDDKSKENIVKIVNYLNENNLNNKYILSAGTVLNKDEVDFCIENGIKIFFSPCFDIKLYKYCCTKNRILIPGVFTPNEIMDAYNNGVKIFKFYPLYDNYNILKQYLSLFKKLDIKFIPSGGIHYTNYHEIFNLSEEIIAISSSTII